MRFGFLAASVALAGFITGYSWSRVASKETEVGHATSQGSMKLAAFKSKKDAERAQLLSTQDFFALLERSFDPIDEGERIVSAIDRFDAPTFADLFSLPQSLKLQEKLDGSWPEDAEVLDRMMMRWLTLDAEADLAWLPTASKNFPSKYKGSFDSIAERLLVGATRRFPERALAFTTGLVSDERENGEIVRIIAETIAKQDLKRARDLPEHFRDDSFRHAARRGYLSGLAVKDPLAALAQTAGAEQRAERDLVRGSIPIAAEKMTLLEVETLCNSLESNPRNSVIERFACSDPAGAVRLIEDLEAQKRPGESLDLPAWSVEVAYGRSAGASALEWARALPDGDNRENVISSVVEGWAQRDPAAVVRQVIEIFPEGKDRNAALDASVAQWMRSDADSALAWVDALPEGKMREIGEVNAITYLPYLQREEEALVRFSQISPEVANSFLPQNAAATLGEHDPRRLTEWSVYFAEAGRPYQTVGDAVEKWFVREPQAAGEWVSALPAGKIRDDAAAGMRWRQARQTVLRRRSGWPSSQTRRSGDLRSRKSCGASRDGNPLLPRRGVRNFSRLWCDENTPANRNSCRDRSCQFLSGKPCLKRVAHFST